MGSDPIHFTFNFLSLFISTLNFLSPSFFTSIYFLFHYIYFLIHFRSFKALKCEKIETNYIFLPLEVFHFFGSFFKGIWTFVFLLYKRWIFHASLLIQYNLWFNIRSINDCVYIYSLLGCYCSCSSCVIKFI